MAYNEKLAGRIRELLVDAGKLEEKRMFRGITFMVNGKMCVSTGGEEIMCRVAPSKHEELIEKEGCREMIHGGKVMKGFIFVHEDVIRTRKDLAFWIREALAYNKIAKAARKK